MQVKEIMTHSAVVIHPDSTLQEAAQKMKELDRPGIAERSDRRRGALDRRSSARRQQRRLQVSTPLPG